MKTAHRYAVATFPKSWPRYATPRLACSGTQAMRTLQRRAVGWLPSRYKRWLLSGLNWKTKWPWGHGHLLGFVIHRLVGQRQAHAMRQRREAMRPRGALFLAASQGLALNGDSLLACLRAAHLPPKPLSPGPALGF